MLIKLLLLGRDVSHSEIARSGMSQEQSARAGVGVHGSRLGECDAYLIEPQPTVYGEDDTLIGQTGVAYCWAYTLEAFAVELSHRQVFVGRIAPIGFAHLFVHLLGSGFGQSVEEGLPQHIVLPYSPRRGGKEAYPIVHPVALVAALRQHIVRQAQTDTLHALLAQAGQTPLILEHQVVAIAATRQNGEARHDFLALGSQGAEHRLGLGVEFHRHLRLRFVVGGETVEPRRATSRTAVHLGHRGKARRYLPGVEKVCPTDVRDEFVDGVGECSHVMVTGGVIIVRAKRR